MDFMDIPGAESWEDGCSNKNLHSQLFTLKKEPKNALKNRKRTYQNNEGKEDEINTIKKKLKQQRKKESSKKKSMKKKTDNELIKTVNEKFIQAGEPAASPSKTVLDSEKDTAEDKDTILKLVVTVDSVPHDSSKQRKKKKRKPRKNKFKDLEHDQVVSGDQKVQVEQQHENVKKGDFESSENCDNVDKEIFREGPNKMKKGVKNTEMDGTNGRTISGTKTISDGKKDLELHDNQSKKKGKKVRNKTVLDADGKIEMQGKELKIQRTSEMTSKNKPLGKGQKNKPSRNLDGFSKTSSHANLSIAETDSNLPNDDTNNSTAIVYASSKSQKSGMSLKDSLQQQLKSARFRFLNEKLYKSSSEEAYQLLNKNKEAVELYHEGYQQQVQQWPTNPVDVFITYLQKKSMHWIVGDFGCGEAKIAQSVKQKVFSFDLYPLNEHITPCNIAKVPLEDNSLDVAVFCLSLMGTDWIDFLREAHRVLKDGGKLKIAEVASRFSSESKFVNTLKALGFRFLSRDLSNKMFYLFDFTKTGQPGKLPKFKSLILKPCSYKPR